MLGSSKSSVVQVGLAAQLTDSKVAGAIQQLIKNVPELTDYYLSASFREKPEIIKRLKESYVHECCERGQIISLDCYALDMEQTIGWEWVLSN